jgi:hypothetical protein
MKVIVYKDHGQYHIRFEASTGQPLPTCNYPTRRDAVSGARDLVESVYGEVSHCLAVYGEQASASLVVIDHDGDD